MASPPPDAPAPEGPAQTPPERLAVGYLARDLFFEVRLAEGLKRLGWPGRPLAPAELGGALPPLRLLIVDLSAPQERWQPAIEAAHAAGTPVLAFGSHMDQARWRWARAAGATRIVASSRLAGHLPELIRRLVGPAGPAGAGADAGP